MSAVPIWYLDTSSLVGLRSQFSREDRRTIFDGLSALVTEGRLRFPPELVPELRRYAGDDNPALSWALQHPSAVERAPLEVVAEVLKSVPEVLDADKEGVEEADVYVLALAYDARRNGQDARIVTEEFKTTVAKMPLGSAAGYLGVPSVSIRTMLKFEKIREF